MHFSSFAFSCSPCFSPLSISVFSSALSSLWAASSNPGSKPCPCPYANNRQLLKLLSIRIHSFKETFMVHETKPVYYVQDHEKKSFLSDPSFSHRELSHAPIIKTFLCIFIYIWYIILYPVCFTSSFIKGYTVGTIITSEFTL